MLEFQSGIDPFMAVRIGADVALLYQDLIEQKCLTPNRLLPPVLPVVLYNGEGRWQAAAALFQLDHARDEATWLGLYQRLPAVLDGGDDVLRMVGGAAARSARWPVIPNGFGFLSLWFLVNSWIEKSTRATNNRAPRPDGGQTRPRRASADGGGVRSAMQTEGLVVNNRYRRGWLLLALSLAWPMAFAGQQIVTPTPAKLPVRPGQVMAFTVGYQSANPCTGAATGLGLRLHWDSSKLALTGLTGVLPTALVTHGPAQPDTADLDGDPATDRLALVAWADIDGAWPGGGCASVPLLTARLQAVAGFTGSSAVRLSASSTAAGFTLSAVPAVFALDSDGDGVPDSDDAFPNDPNESRDTDRDGVGDNRDNCPAVVNPDQADRDADGVGDACSAAPFCWDCLPGRGGWRGILR